MSRVFDALRQSELERNNQSAAGDVASPVPAVAGEAPAPAHTLQSFSAEASALLADVPTLTRVFDASYRLVTLDDPHSLAAEKFRLLATRLCYMQERQGIRKIVISSAGVEDGKSFIAINLALTLAGMKKKVLLIDGDLRQPTVSKLLGHRQLPGVKDWFFQNRPLTECVRKLEHLPMWVLPAGGATEQPLPALQSPRMADLLTQATGWVDWVVIDAPPVLPMADVTLWSRLADGLLLAVREGQTRKALLERAIEAIDPTKLLGLVLNHSTDIHHDLYKNYYQVPNLENEQVKAAAR